MQNYPWFKVGDMVCWSETDNITIVGPIEFYKSIGGYGPFVVVTVKPLNDRRRKSHPQVLQLRSSVDGVVSFSLLEVNGVTNFSGCYFQHVYPKK